MLQKAGWDEVYCMWYKCNKCGGNNIAIEYKYCPDCGNKNGVIDTDIFTIKND